MADSRECAICKKMIKEKHKYDKFYRIGFWVVLILLSIITTLYLATGEVFKKTEIVDSNNRVVNIQDNSGNNTVSMGDNYGSYIVS